MTLTAILSFAFSFSALSFFTLKWISESFSLSTRVLLHKFSSFITIDFIRNTIFREVYCINIYLGCCFMFLHVFMLNLVSFSVVLFCERESRRSGRDGWKRAVVWCYTGCMSESSFCYYQFSGWRVQELSELVPFWKKKPDCRLFLCAWETAKTHSQTFP